MIFFQKRLKNLTRRSLDYSEYWCRNLSCYLSSLRIYQCAFRSVSKLNTIIELDLRQTQQKNTEKKYTPKGNIIKNTVRYSVSSIPTTVEQATKKKKKIKEFYCQRAQDSRTACEKNHKSSF